MQLEYKVGLQMYFIFKYWMKKNAAYRLYIFPFKLKWFLDLGSNAIHYKNMIFSLQHFLGWRILG